MVSNLSKEVWKLNFRQYGQMKSTARKKLSHGESQKGEDKRWRRSEVEKFRREKMQVRVKVGKSQNTVFFPVFCGSGRSKSRLAKAAGAEPVARRCGSKHISK